MKTFITKDTTKTAPSSSFILVLLVAVDKSSEFDWICVDQGLDFILEGHAIFCGMPSNSPWYPHLALTSCFYGYGGLLGLAGMAEIP